VTPTYLITSDIHGSVRVLERVLEKARAFKADAILIAGDLCPPENPLFSALLRQEIPVHSVRGNCDSSYEFSNASLSLPPLVWRTVWKGRELVMTHGDRFPSPYGLDLKKGDIFLCGHTHVPKVQMNAEGILTINPGSPTYPRTSLGPSYAIMDAEGVSIRAFDDDRYLPSLQYDFFDEIDQ
jgi:putative phosphoesterase